MKLKLTLAALVAANLSGCAVVKVCNDHPVACSTAAAVLVSGSVAAYENHRLNQQADQLMRAAAGQ